MSPNSRDLNGEKLGPVMAQDSPKHPPGKARLRTVKLPTARKAAENTL